MDFLWQDITHAAFWLAALMAMRYNRLFVYLGSMSALVVMTVLSVCIGVAVPALLPRAYTHYLAAALFAYFALVRAAPYVLQRLR